MKEFYESVERSLAKKPDFVQPSTIVIGLGNPILGDDGVGWRVVEQVKAGLSGEGQIGLHSYAGYPVEVDCLSLGGLSLMERLIGYDQTIIIDAIKTEKAPVGQVTCFPLEDLPKPGFGHLNSAHDTSLQIAITVGRSMGAKLPERIMVVAIESPISYDFSEHLSSEVEAAVPQAEKIVFQLLSEWSEEALNCQEHRHVK